MSGRVYTVDPGRPFLAVLAEALLAGNLPVPGGAPPHALGLADVTIYLPTRRPARALQHAFLAAAGGRALLLPRIKVLGEGGEELELLAEAATVGVDAAADVPRALGELERQLVLTALVRKWDEARRRGSGIQPYTSTAARGPAQAARLARELARLIDGLETEGIDLARLESLVADEYAEHWSPTLEFLKIALQLWPAHLEEQGLRPVAVAAVLGDQVAVLEHHH